MLYIFLSYHNNSINQYKKIKSTNKEFIQKVYLEDYLLTPFEIEKKDIIYILSNSIFNIKLIELLKNRCYIINQKFYEKKYDKLSIQNKLKDLGVLVPKIIDINEINEDSFPIMCKSKKHTDFVETIDTFEKLNNIIYKHKNKYYLETKLKYDKEIKVYFVKNEIFFYDNQTLNINKDKVNTLCNLISKEFNLEVFSLDILVYNYDLFVIDVNPAAGLYNSILAREKFAKYIKS